jgi:hypothetical protein
VTRSRLNPRRRTDKSSTFTQAMHQHIKTYVGVESKTKENIWTHCLRMSLGDCLDVSDECVDCILNGLIISAPYVDNSKAILEYDRTK